MKTIRSNFVSSRGRGFSLIELMIALVAGLIVSYAVVAFTMSSMKSNGEYVQSARLTQELRNSLNLVTRDLRRAGYDEDAMGHLAAGTNSPFVPILIQNAGADDSCIIYAYDRAGGNGGTVELANGEVRGLRRVTATVAGRQVGIIEYGVSAGTSKPTCGAASATYTTYPPACNGLWCPLSDPATLNITRFRLTDGSTNVGSGTSQVRIRNLDVNIQGRLAGDDGTSYLNGVSTSYLRGISSTVKVRSECSMPVITDCNLTP